jgi:cytochrome c
MRKLIIASAAIALSAGAAMAQSGGKAISEADIKNWDISILPDGTNLPPGTGTPAQGAKIFAEKCAMCHGPEGKGGGAPGAGALVGNPGLATVDAPKTITNMYAYATTLFDFIRRAMPATSPRTLKDDEVYALTAYLLAQNKIIKDDDVMDSKNLPVVKMPQRDNLYIPFPDRI